MITDRDLDPRKKNGSIWLLPTEICPVYVQMLV